MLLSFVWVYRVTLSPFLGGNCRFNPTCSEYAIQAIKTHSPSYSLFLIFKRISQCHPWGPYGYDPIPSKGIKP